MTANPKLSVMWHDHIQHLKGDIFSWLSRATPDVASQAVEVLGSAIGSVKGATRQENQDCAVAVQYHSGQNGPIVSAFVLCDGIGGMQDGGVCARVATAMFIASLVGHKFERALPRALRAARAANDEVFEAYHENGGTTLSCMVFQQKEITALNVGDSRIYRLSSGGVSQLTTDDTIANQMKQLRPGDPGLSNASLGKQLTQFIGMGQDVQFRHFDPRNESLDGTGFLLTSDGVHGMSAETFRDIALCALSPLEVVKRLTTVARWGKSNDNGTVVCVGREVDIAAQDESSSPERLLIWDSHSRLDVLLDTRAWSKDRRGKSTAAKKPSQRKSGQGQLKGPPDLQAGVPQIQRETSSEADTQTANEPRQANGARSTGEKPSQREPLQLEIIEQMDDKSPD